MLIVTPFLLLFYLAFYKLNCMLIGKALDVEPIAHNIDHRAAILVHEIGNIERLLLGEALYRFVPMTQACR